MGAAALHYLWFLLILSGNQCVVHAQMNSPIWDEILINARLLVMQFEACKIVFVNFFFPNQSMQFKIFGLITKKRIIKFNLIQIFFVY